MFQVQLATWSAAERVLRRHGRPVGNGFHLEVALLAASYVRIDDLFAFVGVETAAELAFDHLDGLRSGARLAEGGA